MHIFNKHPILTVLALVAFSGCGDSTPAANTDLGEVSQDSGPALETLSDSNTEVEQPDIYVETGPGLGIDYNQSESGAVPKYEADDAHWLAVGWPNNRRLLNTGAPDLTGFAQPGLALLSNYLLYGMEVLDGFSTVGSIYFEFSAALLHSELPEPQDSTHPLSVVQLVNVSPSSAYYGKQVPLRFRFEAEGDAYYSPNTLAARPVFGLPLESAQEYCLLITRGVKDAQGRYLSQAPEFVKALPEHTTLASLRHWLKDSPLHSSDIAVATCFTTQDPTREMREIGAFLDQQPSPEVSSMTEPAVYGEFHGSYSSPNFQAGDKPYYSEGDIRFDADGQPVVQEQDLMRFMVLIPRNSSMPASGWPIVLYAHGTGGDYESCRGTAGTLNAVGMAVLCVDQPLHGVRGPDPKKTLSDNELVTTSFNFVNPKAGRTAFRQSAIDTMVLTRMVEAGRFDVAPAQSVNGEGVVLDSTRLFFFGHSHGGLSGAMLMGVETRISAAVLSGAGGGLINTVLRRKDPVDLKELVISVLGAKAESFDTFHPALSIIQMLVDATDPINYSRYWFDDTSLSPPVHIFVTEGTADHATPSIGTDNMAAAAGVPLLYPLAQASTAHALRDMNTQTLPVTQNAANQQTAALRQWQDQNHWVAFNDTSAQSMWTTFLQSAANEDAPTIGLQEGLKDWTWAGPLSGSDCATAPQLDSAALPLQVRGNSSLNEDKFHGCNGSTGQGRRDSVYRFTPNLSGHYRFRLSTPPKEDDKDDDAPPTGPDRLLLTTQCAPALTDCLGEIKSGKIDLDLSAGTDYWLIVDGSTEAHVGPFVLQISSLCVNESCLGKECGQAGCGYCGSCSEGQQCSSEGQCVQAAQGDHCENPFVLDHMPAVGWGTTQGFNPDYSFGKTDCPGFAEGPFGGGSSDLVYQVTAPVTGRYVFDLAARFDASLYVVSNCHDIAGSCLGAHRRGGGGETVSVELTAGQTVFAIVDGATNNSNQQGYYTLRVGQCVPDCAQKSCGGDGCGGSCGECPTKTRCLEETECHPIPYQCAKLGECVDSPPGDTCASPVLVDKLPFSYSGKSSDFYSDYQYGKGTCPGSNGAWGQQAPDVAFALTAKEDGIYRAKLKSQWDSVLYVVSDCADINNSCLRAHQKTKGGNENLYVTLSKDQSVYVIVDGGNDKDDVGSFTLQLSHCTPNCEGKVCGSDGCGGSCGQCANLENCTGGQCVIRPGTTCAEPISVFKVPYKHETEHKDWADFLSNPCAEGTPTGDSDVLYRFEAPKDGDFSAWLEVGADASLAFFAECNTAAEQCLGSAEGQGTQVTLSMKKDESVYLLVQGKGTHLLRIEETCVPQCEDRECGDDGCESLCGVCNAPSDICDAASGHCLMPIELIGNTVEKPFEINALELPVALVGDTSSARNHYSFVDGACPLFQGKGGASNDQVWRLKVLQTGEYLFDVLPQDFDAAIYLVTSADINSSCLAAWDGEPNDRLTVSLEAGSTIYVVVDGGSNLVNQSGAYELTVVGP